MSVQLDNRHRQVFDAYEKFQKFIATLSDSTPCYLAVLQDISELTKMDTSASGLTPDTTASSVSASPARIHSAGGLGLAGLFGGPLAISYLIYRNLISLGRTDLLPKAAAWFIPCVLLWAYCILSFPPDLISQWIPYLPQTILWWIVVRHLFAGVHAEFAADGGVFKPRWQAVRFGFFTFLGLKVGFFAIGVLKDLWVQ